MGYVPRAGGIRPEAFVENFLHIFFIWLHILGVALFVGPQFFLAFAWVPASRTIDDMTTRIKAMRTITRRFGYVGGVGLALIVIAGSYLVGTWRSFYSQPDDVGFMDLRFGVVFIVIGIAFKFGAAPFHAWVPDVYQGSPTGVTLFVASAPKVAAFGMAYRLLDNGFGTPALWSQWSAMLSVLAVLSLVIGNVVAIAQTNLKRMLAYSTISHVGFLLLGIIGGGADGFGAALFYATTYSITTVAAFGLIVLLSRSGFEAEEIEDFRGLNQRNPFYAFLMLVVMASFAGVPLFVGFLAKLQVLKAVIRADALWLAIAGGLFAVVGAFYYLRVIKVMYFDEPAAHAPVIAQPDAGFRLVLAANVLALIGLGIFGGPLMTWCLSAVAAS